MGIINRFFFRIEPGGEPKKKEDRFSLKNIKHGLYKKLFNPSKISVITGINKNLEKDITELKDYMRNFNKKINLVNQLIKTKDKKHLDLIKDEIANIKTILIKQYDDDKNAEKEIIRAIQSIKFAMDDENIKSVFEKEEEVYDEFIDLKKDIEKLKPCLLSQIKFIKLPINEQLDNIKRLFFDINEEALIIGYEKDLINKLKEDIDKFEIEVIVKPTR